MNVIPFPLARRTPTARAEKQPRRGVQHYLDLGFNDLQRQYRERGEVQSEVTVFVDSGTELKLDLEKLSEFEFAQVMFNCPEVIGGFAIISRIWLGEQFIYLDVRDVRKKALSLFLLNKETGDPSHDIVLVTQIGPPGPDRFKYATPSNWRGRTTTIPISAPARASHSTPMPVPDDHRKRKAIRRPILLIGSSVKRRLSRPPSEQSQ
jgi:hypothetical protein